MNSITYLGPQVYEVGQIKDSIKIVLEPELNIVQFLITDMQSNYFQNKSKILRRQEFIDIDKKFGNQSILQTNIVKDRQESDIKSIQHFITKAENLTKQFKKQSEFSLLLNSLKIKVENIKAQQGQNLFQYQFDLIKENINFAHEIYVSQTQIEQDAVTIILDLLIYNIQLYISLFTTCEYRIQDNKMFINFPDNTENMIEPLFQENQTPQPQGVGTNSSGQIQQQQSQEPLQQQQRHNTERQSIQSNNSQSPKPLLGSSLQQQNKRKNQQEVFFQFSQQFSTNENQQQLPPENNQQQPEIPIINQNIDEQYYKINRLGELLQRKQDKIYFRYPLFRNSKPRRTIFFNLNEISHTKIISLSNIFKNKSIFYSCDQLLIYNNQNQHSFILKIEQQFINTEVKCYSTEIINDQHNFQVIRNLIINDKHLKQILNLRDNQIIYNIKVDDLSQTLIEQFNMDLDKEIIQCL